MAHGLVVILGTMFSAPLAYFISFRTYGTWLHGDERGSVDRVHNEFGTPMLPESGERVRWERSQLKRTPVTLAENQRRVIDTTIREVCAHNGWQLKELNVRTNHAHAVVSASVPPERVMNVFKAWATRRLVEGGLFARGERVWSRHGSTVYLFREDKVAEKCRYVREGQ